MTISRPHFVSKDGQYLHFAFDDKTERLVDSQGGFGAHELVMHYDLVRELLWACEGTVECSRSDRVAIVADIWQLP